MTCCGNNVAGEFAVVVKNPSRLARTLGLTAISGQNDTMNATTTLSNGTVIPNIGLGLWQVPADEVQANVEQGLEIGYRHFDGAAAYGNEEGFGAAIRATGIPRDEIFVTTKLDNPDQGYNQALAAFDASMGRLGLDYVDLYLIHWPMPKRGLFVETWKAFEEIYNSGRAKAIGISNFLPSAIDTLMESAAIAPMVNQFEAHPSLQQRDYEEASLKRGMVVEAYSPIGHGVDLNNSTVQSIAAAHDCSPAQAILAWHLAQGRVVIPKSLHRERMVENLAASKVELTADELSQIDALEAGNRQNADPAERN